MIKNLIQESLNNIYKNVDVDRLENIDFQSKLSVQSQSLMHPNFRKVFCGRYGRRLNLLYFVLEIDIAIA